MRYRPPNTGFLALALFAALLPLLYMGMYYGLVKRGLPTSWRYVYVPAEYRDGGDVAEKVFLPANKA